MMRYFDVLLNTFLWCFAMSQIIVNHCSLVDKKTKYWCYSPSDLLHAWHTGTGKDVYDCEHMERKHSCACFAYIPALQNAETVKSCCDAPVDLISRTQMHPCIRSHTHSHTHTHADTVWQQKALKTQTQTNKQVHSKRNLTSSTSHQ